MVPLVIYHGGCFDGFCSAWLFSKAYPDAEFVAAKHGDPPPELTGPRPVFVVDFSYPHDVLRRMVDVADDVLVLDHHKSAERELAGLEGFYVFDTTKSGARLAWEWLRDSVPWSNGPFFCAFDGPHATRSAPWLVEYTEDRDLWRWELPHSRAVNAALRSYPLEFAEWDRLAGLDPLWLVAEGEAILRTERQVVERHVRHATPAVILGHTVPCVNATVLMSEIGEALSEGVPFSATYYDRDDGLRVYSLRSRPGGVDVSEVAKAFGGGGHRHAAGFQVSTGGRAAA